MSHWWCLYSRRIGVRSHCTPRSRAGTRLRIKSCLHSGSTGKAQIGIVRSWKLAMWGRSVSVRYWWHYYTVIYTFSPYRKTYITVKGDCFCRWDESVWQADSKAKISRGIFAMWGLFWFDFPFLIKTWRFSNSPGLLILFYPGCVRGYCGHEDEKLTSETLCLRNYCIMHLMSHQFLC